MPAFYNKNGNIESWESKPKGYYTVEEWEEMHPPAPPTKEELEAIFLSAKDGAKSRVLMEFNRELENLTGGLDVEGVGVFDCGKQHLTNIEGMIVALEYQMRANGGSEPTITFKMFDNSFKELTLSQLKVAQLQMVLAGQQLYSKKWQYEAAIEAASSVEELDKIGFNKE